MLPGMNFEVVAPLKGLATGEEIALEAILGTTARIRAVGGDPGSLEGSILLSRKLRSTSARLVALGIDSGGEDRIIADVVRDDSVSAKIVMHGQRGGRHVMNVAHVQTRVDVGPVIHVRSVRVAQEATSARAEQARRGGISTGVSIIGVRHYECLQSYDAIAIEGLGRKRVFHK